MLNYPFHLNLWLINHQKLSNNKKVFTKPLTLMDTIEIPTEAEVEQGVSGPIWLDPNGIVVTINKGEPEHTLEHAKLNIAAISKMSKNIPRPLLVDFTKVKYMSREAREHYTNKENSQKVKAVGIISNSLVGMMIANFFIGINKSHVPSRIFNSYDEAIEWLKQYI